MLLLKLLHHQPTKKCILNVTIGCSLVLFLFTGHLGLGVNDLSGMIPSEFQALTDLSES